MVTVIPSVSNICRGGCVCYHKNCHRLVESRTKEKRWRPGHWTLRVTCSFVEGGGLSSRARFIGGVSSNCTQFPLRNTGHRCLWSQAVTCDLIPSPGRWTDPLSLESDQQMESGRHLSQESSRRERCSANTWLPFSPLPSLEQTWGCLRLSSVGMWCWHYVAAQKRVWGSPSRMLRNAVETLTIALTTQAEASGSVSLGIQCDLKVWHLMHLKAHPREKYATTTESVTKHRLDRRLNPSPA